MMINRILLFACFLSGAASLCYEILWTRAFALILGSTVQAAALVFAAFLTGLALGAWLFGNLADRMERPLRAYVMLELGIAVVAVVTGLILHHQADAIGALLGGGATKYWVAFGLAVLMILPPTILMGGTLPVLLNVAQRHDGRLAIVGRFYGWNTLGAAAGTLVCGFLTIRLLGVTHSYLFAMGLNVLVAVLCMALVRHSDNPANVIAAKKVANTAKKLQPLAESYLLLVAGTSGAVVLSLEVIWARFSGFLLGNRTYAFTLLMFTVLTLLAMGSWLSARLYRYSLQHPARNPYRVFVGLTVFAAAALALSAACGWWLIDQQAMLEARLPQLQDYIVFYRFGEAFTLLAGPLILLGALFPLCIAHSRHCATHIGRTSARYYVVNAVGIVIGSLGTGFVAVSYLGSFGVFKLLVGVLLALTFYSCVRIGRPLPRYVPVIGLLALAVVLYLPGSYPPRLEPGEQLILESEDEYGVFRLTRTARGNIRVTNNQVELVYHLGAYSTDYVQQMQGHLGMHFNPNAQDALVIGSGYGITAGALASYPGIVHVDAVELLPSMVRAAELFAPNNLQYYESSKVQISVDDGRHFLVRQGKQYDIISLNVSDPHLPGGATLFHTDFYELAKRHLKPRGVIIQHVFGSERAIIANTLVQSFPYTQFSQSYSNGYNVVASMQPLDEAAARRMRLPEPALRQLRKSGRRSHISMPQHQQYDDLPLTMHSDVVATDDFPAVEFSWNPGIKALFINE